MNSLMSRTHVFTRIVTQARSYQNGVPAVWPIAPNSRACLYCPIPYPPARQSLFGATIANPSHLSITQPSVGRLYLSRHERQAGTRDAYRLEWYQGAQAI